MRYLLTALLLLLCAATAQAGVFVGFGQSGGSATGDFTLVQQSGVQVGSTAVTLDGVTAGSLVVVVYGDVETSTNLTCTSGTALSAVAQFTGTYVRTRVFYRVAETAGNHTYTVSGTLGGTESIWAGEFSYTGGTAVVDVYSSGLGDGVGSVSSGSITTTGSGEELVIGTVFSYAGGNTSGHQINGTAATAVYENTSGDVAVWYRLPTVTFTGAATATDPGNGYWVSGIVGFKVQ